jgi:phosphatidylglycerol---prolipoprotein diacylglyceryl transferase
MRPVLFRIGDISIGSFWTMAFLGFLAAFLVVRSDVLRRGFRMTLAYDMILYAYVGGWVGARLFIIPTGWDYFVKDPITFLFMSSGWVWYGGIIGGAVALWILSRREQHSFWLLADICAPALAMGLAIGRIGCQLSGDGDYGVPTDLPWCMSYPDGVVPTTECVHPAPVYEMIASLAIFGYLWRRRHSDPAEGDLFGRYLILSSVVRLLIEFVRRNPAWLFGLTTAQWISIGLIAAGVALVRRARAVSTTGPALPHESVARTEPAA